MKKKPCILLGICLLATQTLANNLNDLAESTPTLHKILEQRLANFVYDEATLHMKDEMDGRQLTVETSSIDPRIDIPQCDEEFTMDLEPSSLDKSHFSVRIACDNQNWFTYSTVKLILTQGVVVTSSMLSPNTLITADHVKVEQVNIRQVRTTGFQNIEDVIGAKLKYRTRPGQPVTRNMLCYVCQGDRITIAAHVGSMRVKTTGIAQEDGTLGETIEVMNARSKKKILAQVASTQEVIVSL